MNFVEVVLNFKRNLEVFELLRDEPTANEVGDDQRKQQWSHGVGVISPLVEMEAADALEGRKSDRPLNQPRRGQLVLASPSLDSSILLRARIQ